MNDKTAEKRSKIPCWDQKRSLQGSFTLEAAVIVPLAMVMMVGVIFLAFWVHDAASMTAVNDYAVLSCASQTDLQPGGVSQKTVDLLSSRLIAAKDISSSLQGSDAEGKAVSSANITLPLAMLRTLLGEESQHLYEEVEISNLNGRKKLLLYKSICDGAEHLIGGMTDS